MGAGPRDFPSGAVMTPTASLRLALAAGLAVSGLAAAQVVRDGHLVYPNTPVSRALTPVERQWMKTHQEPGGGTDTTTPPPIGPLHCAAEYEPQEGIIISWQGNGG